MKISRVCLQHNQILDLLKIYPAFTQNNTQHVILKSDEPNYVSNDTIYNITTRTSARRNDTHATLKVRTHVPQNYIKIKMNNCQDKWVAPSLHVTNVCHILNKVDELSGIAAINKPSVVLITESWLSPNIPDNVINIRNTYNAHRHDRSTPGGGVLAKIDSNIPVIRLPE